MKRLIALLFLLLAAPAHALDWLENAELAKHFDQAGVRGTFVLYDVAAGRMTGHDGQRARTRFVPASTFKIVNSLIGLSSGAVKDVDEVLPYGGKPQPYPSWEHDMGLREAIRISNVPAYQELARRIGLTRMREGVARLDYGNGDVGPVVDRFWLDGPLKISAAEQTRFLARLAQGALPFPRDVQAAVREIVQLEHGEHWTLYGKTGWATGRNPDIGWWVGWVATDDRLYTFALNIDMPRQGDAAKRIPLARACLKTLGVQLD